MVTIPSQAVEGLFLGSAQEKNGFCEPVTVILRFGVLVDFAWVILPPDFRKASTSEFSWLRVSCLDMAFSRFCLTTGLF